MQPTPQEKNSHLEDIKNKAFATLTVFARNETFLGLPSKVFILGVVLTLSILFMLFWLAGIFFGVLFYWGMYKIHEKDQKAFEIWLKAYRRSWSNPSSRWDAGRCKTTRLIIIK